MMLKCSADNKFAYDLLEDANMLFSDFTIDHVIAFDHENNFCVIIYMAATRNFTSFTAENYLQNSNVLPSLLECMQDYSSPAFADNLIDKAIRLVEDKMHSSNNANFYFDAH